MNRLDQERRKAQLAKVHIAKKALALEEESYRALLRRITGLDSSATCDEAQLDAILREFKRLGFSEQRKFVPASRKAYVRKIYAIWQDLRPYLRDPSVAALRRFVQRQTKTPERPAGVSDPQFLSPEDGNLVIEGLKAWLSRAKGADPG